MRQKWMRYNLCLMGALSRKRRETETNKETEQHHGVKRPLCNISWVPGTKGHRHARYERPVTEALLHNALRPTSHSTFLQGPWWVCIVISLLFLFLFFLFSFFFKEHWNPYSSCSHRMYSIWLWKEELSENKVAIFSHGTSLSCLRPNIPTPKISLKLIP